MLLNARRPRRAPGAPQPRREQPQQPLPALARPLFTTVSRRRCRTAAARLPAGVRMASGPESLRSREQLHREREALLAQVG